MEKYKISVIVSVYNTEKYLEKCLESLLSQTYQNMELILIEDGSTDNSKDILKKYEKNKKCHVIYNDGNKGLAYSRNIGMKEASGDYLGFIDSDDYVEKEYYENLMHTILKENADVAICDFNLVFEEDNHEMIQNCFEGDFDLLNILNNGLVASACNKLFKTEVIRYYDFPVGKLNEDIAVIIPTLVKAKKIAYADDCKYNYVQREKSIQNSKFNEKRFDIFACVDLTLTRIKSCNNYEAIKDSILFNQIIRLLLFVIPKEKNFIYRYKTIKKYGQLATKYDLKNNRAFQKFLNETGKKHAFYYRIVVNFVIHHLYLATNLLFSCYKLAYKILKRSVISKKITIEDLTLEAIKQKNRKEEKIKISVIVPNYNYEKFLLERLYSILRQNYKIYELIFLDDCSTDQSRVLFDEIENKISKLVPIKKIYNEKNSGSAFKQWQKGFSYAKGDYVWIAEADDYCQKKLLKTLVKPIKQDENIVISYADTAFIDAKGNLLLKSIKKELDIQNTGHWDKSYINDGVKEIKKYSYLNDTIANVSSSIIKNGEYQELLKESLSYKQSGDWIFYINLLKTGDIAYTDKVLNYYRMHGNNISSQMKNKDHIEEIKKIHAKNKEEFQLGKKEQQEMAKRIDFLKKVWKVE